MPAAALKAIPAVVGAAGAAGSSAGGKKASNKGNALAQQQLQLQQDQFGLTKQQYGLGNTALGTASDWYNNLMKGGQAAVQATGPYASLIGQTAEGNRNAIQAATPRGGEQNLAIAQNYNQAGNNIARLYAGMQPLAAQGLTGIGSAYLGSGSAVNPQASPYAAASIYQSQLQNAQQGASGFGSLLFNALNKARGGGGGKQSGSSGGYGDASNLGGNLATL